MAPSYILGRNIAPMNTTSAIKLRLVRTYEIPERRGAATIKCKECVFHDQEGTVLHGTIPRDLVQKYSTMLKVGDVIFLDGGCRRTKDDDTEDGGKLWKFVVERM
nr:putative transposase [Ipomoea batatas]GMD86701.1 putative transposase [Ipomoea batatas]